MSHVDGPVYFPCVANLSLGSHTVMNLTPYRHPDDHSQHEPAVRLLLQPRSLLLLSSDACVQTTAVSACSRAVLCCVEQAAGTRAGRTA